MDASMTHDGVMRFIRPIKSRLQ